MLTKEIKHKEYLRGTKAVRLRNLMGVGVIIITTIIGIPLGLHMMKTIGGELQESKLSAEEREREKIKTMFEFRAEKLAEPTSAAQEILQNPKTR